MTSHTSRMLRVAWGKVKNLKISKINDTKTSEQSVFSEIHTIYVCNAIRNLIKSHFAVADLGWFLGFHGTPLWAAPSTKKY